MTSPKHIQALQERRQGINKRLYDIFHLAEHGESEKREYQALCKELEGIMIKLKRLGEVVR